MGVQAGINRLIGTIGAGAVIASKMATSDKKESTPKADKKATGVDAKMAAKARRTAQQKINAIYANKEISSKAKTRRIGKVLDEMGGKK